MTPAMTPRKRMALAMRHREPDRVPVMCQLALGHYFLHSGFDPVEVWHDSEVFADALVLLQRRYGFDGILVNLPGREPDWRRHVQRIERAGREQRVHWKDGLVTVVPDDDNAHVYLSDGRRRFFARFEDVDPARLHYVDPHDSSGMSWPWRWGFADAPARSDAFFPPWQDAAVRAVRARAPDVSVHAEVFSPFTQLLELLDFENGLLALLDDPEKVEACLEALAEGTSELMRLLAAAGADAILISSAFAGAGFISPAHYRRFVLPFERRAIAGFRAAYPDVPVYTHTCGAIGDRLELLEETGTAGIDTLDPPPLGDVDLADARRRVGDRLFIKGNIDPVNTVLRGTPAQVREDAERRLHIAMSGGGYILSTACSVPPAAPPANILELRAAAETAGRYAAARDGS
jgi:uroporphyrinogen-III decarboxylase